MAELSDTYSTPRNLFQSRVHNEDGSSEDDTESESGGTKEKLDRGEDADAAKTTEADAARVEAMQALSPKMKMMYGKEEIRN